MGSTPVEQSEFLGFYTNTRIKRIIPPDNTKLVKRVVVEVEPVGVYEGVNLKYPFISISYFIDCLYAYSTEECVLSMKDVDAIKTSVDIRCTKEEITAFVKCRKNKLNTDAILMDILNSPKVVKEEAKQYLGSYEMITDNGLDIPSAKYNF